MSLPADFSAIESADYSYLFYTRTNGTIAYLKSNTTHEGNDTTYTASSVTYSNSTVIAAVPRLSAVAYTLHGKREVRSLLSGGHSSSYTALPSLVPFVRHSAHAISHA